MKVLITGADGFIGSHLTELMLSEGHEVTALSYYNSFNFWGWLEDIPHHPRLKVVSGDIRDPHFCKDLVKGQDLVFHLAALIAIPYSYHSPASYIDTNVAGTMNMCKAALENNCRRILVTSTSEVYGTAKYVPIDEKHPLQPQSPYSASKIGADAIAMSFHHSFGLPLTLVRPFNTYGPRQSARAIIPTIISQVLNNYEEISVGDITPTRDFTFVEDTCRGFLALAECEGAAGKVVNIGTNTEVSVADLIDMISKLTGKKVKYKQDESRLRPKGSEVYRLWCDNSLLKELTSFSPAVTLEQGLLKTITWFSLKENLAKYKAHLYNV
ncbi:MAG: SDR family NAD(P)-dependent oxidoreductase [Bacteroidia bacterium]|nr:SDR family NAD(P)-dependent oxidoreductase [Bacteroidia bacterium]